MPLDPKKIRARRIALKLSQQEAGEAAGLGDRPIQRWSDLEAGRHPNPRLETLERIAAALRWPIAKLLRPTK